MPFDSQAEHHRAGRRPPGTLERWGALGATALLLTLGFNDRRLARPPVSRNGDDVSPSAVSIEQRGRGRKAGSPSEIPPRGWKDILLRVYRGISEDRLVAIAAGVTFYAILAIFPALAAFISIYGMVADPSTVGNVLNSLSSVLPAAALKLVGDQLNSLTARPPGVLGVTFLVSLAISLWSANSGIKAIFDALNIVYHEKEKRSFVRLNAVSLAFTLAALVAGIVVVAVVAVLPAALQHLSADLGLSGEGATLVSVLRWPILLVLVTLALAFVYRQGPSREKAQWRWVSWGSAVAALLWLGASMLFSWYAANFGSYSSTYGSLGAVIVFMTWIWISSIVILLGAALDAEAEHQTARDTTTGQPRRLGRRGAHMADTIGAPQV